MGDMLGKTVRIDELSLTDTRCKFAMVCVKVDLAAPLLPSLTLFDFAQKVEYEGIHLICFKCGKYGHHGEECSNLIHQQSPQSDQDLASGQPDSDGSHPGSPLRPVDDT